MLEFLRNTNGSTFLLHALLFGKTWLTVGHCVYTRAFIIFLLMQRNGQNVQQKKEKRAVCIRAK